MTSTAPARRAKRALLFSAVACCFALQGPARLAFASGGDDSSAALKLQPVAPRLGDWQADAPARAPEPAAAAGSSQYTAQAPSPSPDPSPQAPPVSTPGAESAGAPRLTRPGEPPRQGSPQAPPVSTPGAESAGAPRLTRPGEPPRQGSPQAPPVSTPGAGADWQPRLTRPGEPPSQGSQQALPYAQGGLPPHGAHHPGHYSTTGGNAPSAAPTGHQAHRPSPAPDRHIERYPTVAELETLMFGHSTPAVALEMRLDRLENAVYQRNYPHVSMEDRIAHLHATLLGSSSVGLPSVAPYSPHPDYPNALPGELALPLERQAPRLSRPGDQELENSPFFTEKLTAEELNRYALDLVNDWRRQEGLPPLSWDATAEKVSREHVQDLTRNGMVSHHNSRNENPDVRYTRAGGTDALVESVVSLRTTGRLKPNRAMIVQLLDVLLKRHDDRQAVLSPDSTHFAFSHGYTSAADRLIGVAETITRHGSFEPIPTEVSVGDKLEIRGVVRPPYNFDKISVAWEGALPPGEPLYDSDDPMPYFAPLDYEAYGQKAERDWEGRIRFMQMVGLAAVAAGSLFMPPVALAAPVILAGPTMTAGGKPKPVSDIPVHGGVKVEGGAFKHKVRLNRDRKEGIYYITVWGVTEPGAIPVPLSRRAVIATAAQLPAADNDSGSDYEAKGNKELKKQAKAKARGSKQKHWQQPAFRDTSDISISQRRTERDDLKAMGSGKHSRAKPGNQATDKVPAVENATTSDDSRQRSTASEEGTAQAQDERSRRQATPAAPHPGNTNLQLGREAKDDATHESQ